MAQKDATTLAYWLKRTRGMKNAKNKAYTLQKRAMKQAGRTGRVDVGNVVKSDWGKQAYLGEAPKARSTTPPVSPTSGTPGPARPPKAATSRKGSRAAGQVAAATVGGAILGGASFGIARKSMRDKARLAKEAARTNKQQDTRERNLRKKKREEKKANEERDRKNQARRGATTAQGDALRQQGRGQTAPQQVKIINYTALGEAPSEEARKGSRGRVGRGAKVSGRR